MNDELTQYERQQMAAWRRQYRQKAERLRTEEQEEKLRQESLVYGTLGKRAILALERIASSLNQISDSLLNIESSFNTSYEE